MDKGISLKLFLFFPNTSMVINLSLDNLEFDPLALRAPDPDGFPMDFLVRFFC